MEMIIVSCYNKILEFFLKIQQKYLILKLLIYNKNSWVKKFKNLMKGTNEVFTISWYWIDRTM